MNNKFNLISSNRLSGHNFLVFIEIVRGSKKKYELDKETGYLILDRCLNTSFYYPANYGFIPLTLCDDNDPLDVFVLTQEILDPMVLVECRPIGVIRMLDDNQQDDKIIAVPVKDLMFQGYVKLSDIPKFLLLEIEHFLLHYKDLEHKKIKIQKIEDFQEAVSVVETALLKYKHR
ncbi:inorganic diphosphatase [Candidatus Phytoplasma bonamiae]|uniref:Inorganic pyrophosphatase n=1 Tax=Candidatus Phytoplasma bonamiae TaxID=2982626 RepID=A0ABT9D4B1_9MOLU|nr:inorganic diphosphatase ['Bonamia sp.' little leaf phytoplasma]MDO8064281.1 inorganic diphosphatase ['Bonamia sp.' little leaf phytoplasma]MDV3174826.1 inorganic diphosphatase ['Bonamia sp.' little leaf phytoplasma]